MKITIDRFEGDYAIVELEDMTMIDMPRQLMPKSAKEGDILSIEIDANETKARKERIGKLMDNFWDA